MAEDKTIATARHIAAQNNFKTKLQKLESLLESGDLSQFPRSVSITSFAEWENEELCVKPISRSIIYGKFEVYISFRAEMKKKLKRVALIRQKCEKKASKLSTLQSKLDSATSQACAFLNQYSIAMSQLTDARLEITRLNQKLARDTAARSKVTPLRSTSSISQNPPEAT